MYSISRGKPLPADAVYACKQYIENKAKVCFVHLSSQKEVRSIDRWVVKSKKSSKTAALDNKLLRQSKRRLLSADFHISGSSFVWNKMSADFDSLPPEITLEILSFLDTKSLCNVSQTCKRWHDIIYNTDLLWIRKCKSLDRKDVKEDIQNGEWRNIFVSNYGTNKIKKLWLEGKFSKAKSADELPCNFLGPFGVETWGSILDAEISRSGWTNERKHSLPWNSLRKRASVTLYGSPQDVKSLDELPSILLGLLSSNHGLVNCKLKYLEAVEQLMKQSSVATLHESFLIVTLSRE